jgi:hypothetical protein
MVMSLEASVAQSAQSRNDNVLQPNLATPFEIARVVNKSRRAWSKDHVLIRADLAPIWKRLRIDPGPFAECAGDCEARVYTHELASSAGPELILKLTRSFNYCRYLIFARVKQNRAAKPRWKFRGYIDHDFNRYEMSRHRVASTNGRNYLVIRGQEGSGSGFALYSETWYQVNASGIKPVLSYPIEGNTYPWPTGLGRAFKAHVMTKRHLARKGNEMWIRYTVTYTRLDYIKNDFAKLFVNEHHVHYIWDKRTHMFSFDARRSDITENEIDAIANIETEDEPRPGKKIGSMTFYSQSEAKAFIGGGYEVFLKYNSHRLMRIAKGRDAEQRQWLKQFLDDCEDTVEKKALLQVLQKQ